VCIEVNCVMGSPGQKCSDRHRDVRFARSEFEAAPMITPGNGEGRRGSGPRAPGMAMPVLADGTTQSEEDTHPVHLSPHILGDGRQPRSRCSAFRTAGANWT
jgi:hypothetical protein